MRELSHRLVAAQEEERKNLSRELHDHVAQVLTGLRMELGRIERTAASADVRIGPAVSESKRLVDQMFQTVRNLALGLRPSMLDDFGLQPALEWHVRDVTGRSGVDVELHTSGDLDALPDAYRTCIYRAVQEALTNCIRHAHAKRIEITVSVESTGLSVRIADDGIGIHSSRRHGLGLRGIEERVKELQGGLTIARGPESGTTLEIRLPAPGPDMEGSLASAAG
jgi:signal transduction histidine kinase